MASPLLTAEEQRVFDDQLAEILSHYPSDRKSAAMLPALHLLQSMKGWLPPDGMEMVARKLEVSPERAYEVATFYVMFHTHPLGRHLVEICTNVSCCLTGGDRIFEHLKHKLAVANKGTTADGRITLREVECLGSCGTAPAMLIDEEMVERVTLEKAERIVEELK